MENNLSVVQTRVAAAAANRDGLEEILKAAERFYK